MLPVGDLEADLLRARPAPVVGLAAAWYSGSVGTSMVRYWAAQTGLTGSLPSRALHGYAGTTRPWSLPPSLRSHSWYSRHGCGELASDRPAPPVFIRTLGVGAVTPQSWLHDSNAVRASGVSERVAASIDLALGTSCCLGGRFARRRRYWSAQAASAPAPYAVSGAAGVLPTTSSPVVSPFVSSSYIAEAGLSNVESKSIG
jgi:hypothetical protein